MKCNWWWNSVCLWTSLEDRCWRCLKKARFIWECRDEGEKICIWGKECLTGPPSGELMSCVSDVVVKSSPIYCGDMERIWWDRERRNRTEIQEGAEMESQGSWCWIRIELVWMCLLGWLLVKKTVALEWTSDKPHKKAKAYNGKNV